MSNNQFNLFFDTELNEGVKVVTLSSVFFSDDDEAHSFIVRTTREGQPVSLEGATVRGYFIRPDNVTIELDGTVNEEGCVVVTLNEACYRKKGRFQLAIRSTLDDVISTVFCCDGGVKPSSSDSYVVDEPIVPSLSDILAKIEYMEEATAAANEAAKRANEAAENAGSAGGGTGGPVTWNQVTQKPSAFTPVAHSHTQSDVSGLTEALAGKADATHTHDYPVKSVNGMTGDVVIPTGGGGTGEGLPPVSEADNGMPLVVENGEWTVGKLEKNAVKGLVTDLITYGMTLNEKAEKQHAEEHTWKEALTWDGDLTGHVVYDAYDDGTELWCRVSDVVPTMDDLANGYGLEGYDNNTGEEQFLYVSMSDAEDRGYLYPSGGLFDYLVAIVPTDNYTFDGADYTFPQRGIYFIKNLYAGEDFFITSLAIPGYVFKEGSDPITPDMISAAPQYHSCTGGNYGVGTKDNYGHLRLAKTNEIFVFDEQGKLLDQDGEIVEDWMEYLADYATGADFMYAFYAVANLEFMGLEESITILQQEVRQLRSDVDALMGK